MSSISLNALDLNLLLAFEALFEERNVTRAAARIGLGQPAMSSALARLRSVFGDPLFTRSAAGMKPTPRARELARPVAEAMARLRIALEETRPFDPSTSTRVFHIAASDYAEALVIPEVLQRLEAAAPRLSLNISRTAYVFRAPADRLESGELDFALGFFQDVSQRGDEGLLAETLYRERFVCIARQGHPRIRGRLTLKQFVETGQVRIIYPGDGSVGTVDLILQGRGLQRRVALTVAHFLSVPPIVASTDLLGVIPERAARAAAPGHRLRIFELPFEMQEFPMALVWPSRLQYDPAHAWLREQFARAFSTATAPRRPGTARRARGSGLRAPDSRARRGGPRARPAADR